MAGGAGRLVIASDTDDAPVSSTKVLALSHSEESTGTRTIASYFTKKPTATSSTGAGAAVVRPPDSYQPVSGASYRDSTKAHASLSAVIDKHFEGTASAAAFARASTAEANQAMVAIALPHAGGTRARGVAPALSVRDLLLPRYEDSVKSECGKQGVEYKRMSPVERGRWTTRLNDDAVRLAEVVFGQVALMGNIEKSKLWKDPAASPSRQIKDWGVAKFRTVCSAADRQRLDDIAGRLYFGTISEGLGKTKTRHLYLIMKPTSDWSADMEVLVKIVSLKRTPRGPGVKPVSVASKGVQSVSITSTKPKRACQPYRLRTDEERQRTSFTTFALASTVAVCSMECALEGAEGMQRATMMCMDLLRLGLTQHFNAREADLLSRSTLLDKASVSAMISRRRHLWSTSYGLSPLHEVSEHHREKVFHRSFSNVFKAFSNFDDQGLLWSMFQVITPKV
jgi:hypothetical protein